MLDHPEGASFTLDVCPKFTALAVFLNNVAHSNLLYGLRVFPEFYPNSRPCDPGKGNHVLAEFRGLLSYKNGMKGAIATQVGQVVALSTLVFKSGNRRCATVQRHGLARHMPLTTRHGACLLACGALILKHLPMLMWTRCAGGAGTVPELHSG